MKIEYLPDGHVRLTPDEGKCLYNITTEKYYSEAVGKENQASLFVEK